MSGHRTAKPFEAGTGSMTDPLDLLLVDGRHMLWRAASAFQELVVRDESDGSVIETGAIYGWLNVTLRTWHKFGGIVMVAWDRREGPIERRKLYADYKRKSISRPEVEQRTPSGRPFIESMNGQELRLKQLLAAFGIRQASSLGWEADDVLATFATRFNGDGMRIGILSGDRDLLQLVTEHTSLIRPGRKQTFDIETPETVKAETGLEPEQILDMKALAGDPGDNVPGARGIGPKIASKLINEHGGWERCLEWAANNPPKYAWHKALITHADNIRLSAQLVALNRSAPLEYIPEARDPKQAYIAMHQLQFQSLMAEGRRELFMQMGGA